MSEVTFHISHCKPALAADIVRIAPNNHPERITVGLGPSFGRARHVEQMDMQYPEQEWVQPLLMHQVVLEQAVPDDFPVADLMQYPVAE